MRLGFLLFAVVLCGVCSAIPTDSSSATAEATATAESAVTVTTSKEGPATSSKVSSSSGSSASARGSGRDFDDDDYDDYEESQMGGDGLSLPLSSAILLSSHHNHHVCIPDVLAFSLLGSRGYPFGTLFPYHHPTAQKLQQELMFLKAFTKAGQHVWKSIAAGHVKPHGLENLAKVAGAISTGASVFGGKGGHGPGGVPVGISSGASSAAHAGVAVH